MWQTAKDTTEAEEEVILLKPQQPKEQAPSTSTKPSSSAAFDSLVSSMAKASLEQKERSSRILLVLDLNGLLVHRVNKSRARKEEKAEFRSKPIPLGKNYWCWRRPYSSEFTEFVFQNFDVLVWSSAMKVNVELLVNLCMKDYKPKLIDIYHQEMCTIAGKHPLETHKPLLLKQLSRVWSKHPQYSERNTLLLDDSKYKAVLNPDHTAIHPKEWTHHLVEDNALAPGGAIRGFLEKLSKASQAPDFGGVASFVSQTPFQSGYSAEELQTEARIADAAKKQLTKKAK